ncbi:MAG: protease modulator HflC [Candidatus Eisenbacteria sp.]|nr:protease modulator HflC [Candidatus Eisenbacteria bacterium]
MRPGNVALIILIVVVLIVVSQSLYSLNEGQQAIITQFGRPVGGAVVNAGLHAKIPFVQTLHRFEKRILVWDGSPDQVPTADKKYIWVDVTARWRIIDPLQFYQSVKNTRGAQARLDDVIDSAARDLVSENILIEVVRNSDRAFPVDIDKLEGSEDMEDARHQITLGRDGITRKILESASVLMPQYGIELMDVQIKRLNYVQAVRQKVYDRMISERRQIASRLRSEGQGAQARIRGMKEKELKQIQSEAYRRAQEIKGEADGTATKIHGDAYRVDPDFYAFTKSLETYRETVGSNSKMILSTDSDFYRFLKRASPR